MKDVAQTEIGASDQGYRTLFEYAADGIVIVDPESYYLDVNPSMCRMIGYSREEFIGLNSSDIVAPAELPNLGHALKILKTTADYKREWLFRKKDGSTFLADVVATMMPDGNILGVIRDITERKKAEASLRKSDAQYRRMLDTTFEGVWITDREAKTTYVNQRMAEMLGLAPPDMIGKVSGYFLSESAGIEIDDRWKQRNSGTKDQYDLCLRHRDGSDVWTIVCANPIHDDSGNFAGSLCMLTDITERKRAEEEFRKSEERFRQYFDLGLIGMCISSPDQGLLEVNQQLCDMLGYDRKVLLRKSWPEMTYPDDLAADIAQFDRIVAREIEGYSIDKRWIRQDGGIIFSTISVRCLRREDGSVDCFIVLVQDITRRKLAEEEETRLHTEIADQRSRLNNIVASVPGVVWEAQGPPEYLSNGFAFVSEHVLEMTGYTVDEWISNPTFWLTIIHPDDQEWVAAKAAAHFVRGGTAKREFRWITRDGRVIWVESVSSVVTDEDGRSVGVRGVTLDITERKRAEQELKRSEERYRDLIENAHDIIYTHDLKGNYTSVNDAGPRISGYSREESLRMSLTDTVAPEYLAIARVMTAEKRSNDSVTSYELEIIAKDGHRVPLEVNTRTIFENGVAVGVQGIARDVTERRLSDLALRESEQRYRLLFERNPLPMWVFDTESLAFLAVNDAAIRHYGYSRDEFLAKTIDDLRSPEELPRGVKEKRGGLGSEAVLAGSLRHLKKDGSIIDVEITSHGLEFAGRPAQLVLVNDVTERKRAAAVQQRRTALLGLRADINVALGNRDLSDQETLQHCTDAMVEHLDATFARIWILNAETNALELRAGSGLYTELDGPHSRVPVGSGNIGLIAQERKAYFTNDVAHDNRISDREWATGRGIVSFAGFPLVVEERIIGVLGLYSGHPLADDEIDALSVKASTISQYIERKRGEAALRNSEEQLRQSQKMEAVGQLAGGIAHDFNNLLTAITGYSELALRKLQAGDPLRGNIEEIKRAGFRAAGLTRQLLAFSRKQVLQPEVLALNAIISELEKMLVRLIGEDIELRTSLAPDLGSIKADPSQLEQIIVNLVVNARDAMPNGGRLTIETRNVYIDEHYARDHVAVAPGTYVLLGVTDTGIGMDEETKNRIFEPFFTTKEVGKGTGLGLSTAYGIVKQSNGNIWVYSEPGHGTTFKVYFPQIGETAPEYKRLTTEEASLQGTETILLIEDDDTLRKLAVEVLRLFGYRVLEAGNGGAALLICERHPEAIDLLLTDVIMPEMGGHEAATRLGKIRPEMKVLYMSGYTDSAIVHHGVLDEGANFIQKPFSPDDLGRKLREVLQRA
jgi:PAS domain S-box-containing protein